MQQQPKPKLQQRNENYNQSYIPAISEIAFWPNLPTPDNESVGRNRHCCAFVGNWLLPRLFVSSRTCHLSIPDLNPDRIGSAAGHLYNNPQDIPFQQPYK